MQKPSAAHRYIKSVMTANIKANLKMDGEKNPLNPTGRKGAE